MKVGLIGGGTVGGGVCEILRLRADELKTQEASFQIVKMCVKDASKKRDFEIPKGCEIVTDPNAVLDDESIEMVVELMGGVTVAKEVVMKALSKGKHVVTGNKALVAAHLPEIQKVRAQGQGSFNYEAAVCGGIPIINAVKHDYAGDEITAVMGIMNGTTNFMLSKMDEDGAQYADVLAEAQKLGYAETPPDFDVEGWDARSKLAILCKLAFGVFVPEESIPCHGITRVSSDDFLYAEMMNATIKNLGVATRNDDGTLSAFVSTCMVPRSNLLAGVAGVLNSVAVTSKNLATCCYSGPGAGRFPTANSVVNDMAMVARGGGRGDPFPLKRDTKVVSEINGCFYVRFLIREGLGIIATLGRLASAQGISINAVLQTPIEDPDKVPFVMTTDATTLTAVQKMCDEFSKEPFCLEAPLVMPLLEDTRKEGASKKRRV
jgi:homoserine dehydrogenase